MATKEDGANYISNKVFEMKQGVRIGLCISLTMAAHAENYMLQQKFKRTVQLARKQIKPAASRVIETYVKQSPFADSITISTVRLNRKTEELLGWYYDPQQPADKIYIYKKATAHESGVVKFLHDVQKKLKNWAESLANFKATVNGQIMTMKVRYTCKGQRAVDGENILAMFRNLDQSEFTQCIVYLQ